MAMSELSKLLGKRELPAQSDSFHEKVLDVVSEFLRSNNWDVDIEPSIGQTRPDLLAIDPSGSAYVFEIKAGERGGHLGSVAQVEAFQEAVAANLGREAHGVLLVSEEIPDELYEASRDVGVLVLQGFQENSETLRELLQSLLPSLRSVKAQVK